MVKDPPYKDVAFYFKTMKECDEFLYVFRDHMCNVPWEKPVEADNFPEMTESQRRYMELGKSPKEKAESNLSWGFCLVDRRGIGLTREQNKFISGLMSQLSENGGSHG